MHKSIFLSINDYKSDPITEIKKIDKVLQKECGYYTTIYSFLKQSFVQSKVLRSRFVDLDDCIDSLIYNISHNYNCYDFERLDSNIQSIIFNEFFNYCEVIFHLLFLAYKYEKKYINGFDENVYLQAIDVIKVSLKSLNYRIVYLDEKECLFEVIKIDPESEIVAAQSEPNIKHAILHYLGARDNDIKEKENRLHQLIDLLEPSFEKYKNDNTVKDIKEYIQMVRHPEIYKTKKEYVWFFKGKEEYLDRLFSLCVFLQQFVISKETLKEFKQLKIECLGEN